MDATSSGIAQWVVEPSKPLHKDKVRGATSATRLPLSRLERPGSTPVLLSLSYGMAVRHRKSATAERYINRNAAHINTKRVQCECKSRLLSCLLQSVDIEHGQIDCVEA
ncbi:hypothetical protein T265_06505 [Opisthorchis viverrini]|uniref:Uncharacterized protein n=1 Tax=Opisthorchis viverrini TaxID=6198 RepID=A0A074ZKE7_OPIVI|nr:hypothetical protein T265_06505 [Opisthorchis viverrini]KER26227.1 hypothetical protein T265_06505 [Opisthorchis viverrini]